MFDDIRRHAGASGGKFLQENIVLAAVEELMTAQGVERSPIAYMGALMMSLQSSASSDAEVYGGVLSLLERALQEVPRQVLISKASRMAKVIVACANNHSEQGVVLRPALTCISRLILAQPMGATPSADTAHLFAWLLEFTLHAQPKVRVKAQLAGVAVLEANRSLSATAARFVETRLSSLQARDVQSALFLLNFVKQAFANFDTASTATVLGCLCRLFELRHALLTSSALGLLTAVTSEGSAAPLPASTLTAIVDSLLKLAGNGDAPDLGNPDAKPSTAGAAAVEGALRTCVAATAALCSPTRPREQAEADREESYTRLPLLATALLRCLWKQQQFSGAGAAAASTTDAGAPAESLSASDLSEMIRASVRPTMAARQAAALASALRDALTPRYMPLWEGVFSACAALFAALGSSTQIACGELIASLGAMHYDKRTGASRTALHAALGAAAKAIGPQAFLQLLPLKVRTVLTIGCLRPRRDAPAALSASAPPLSLASRSPPHTRLPPPLSPVRSTCVASPPSKLPRRSTVRT